jgi:hypothetical protein
MFPFNPRSACILAFLFILTSAHAQRQRMYTYQDLSKSYYKKQKDSLENAWKCPSVFDDRSTQKKYREIWDERTRFITKSIDDNDYVYEKEVVTYVYGIIDQLMKANPSHVKSRPLLLIDRSASVNAYAVGNNLLAVNLGLISFCRSREELALVIAHEMSHNILAHAESAMKQRAELITSDEYKDSLNAVLKSKYERLTRLKKVIEGFSFDRRRHQRYHEGDADSLAIRLMKNAKLTFDAGFFLRLDSADNTYQESLKQDPGKYFSNYGLPVEDAWMKKKSKGLSTRAHNFKDSTINRDSLKTHPDCQERYARNRSQSDVGRELTPIPASIREISYKMLLWNLYKNEALTACLYRVMQEKDRGNPDEWYDFMFSNALTSLYHADRELHRFSSIGVVPKEYVSPHYYQLQTLLEQIPRENLELLCRKIQAAGFWSRLSADEKSFKTFITNMALAEEITEKIKTDAASAFSADHPNSAYREFASPFEKK